MLNTIRIQRDTVALEFLSGGRLAAMAKSVLPDMVASFRSSLPDFNANDKPIPLSSRQREFIRLVEKHSYTNLAPLSVFVPEGLDATYKDYIARLDVSVDHIKHIIDDVLAPFTTYLSQLITNRDQVFNTASMDSLFSKLEEGRKNAHASIGECFKQGSTRTEVKYGDAVKRNADWEEVLHNSDHISTEMNRIDRKQLARKVKECSDLLEIVIAKIKRGELDNAADAVVQNLSNGTYQVASEVEFFSVTYYRVDALCKSIKATTEKIENIFEH